MKRESITGAGGDIGAAICRRLAAEALGPMKRAGSATEVTAPVAIPVPERVGFMSVQGIGIDGGTF